MERVYSALFNEDKQKKQSQLKNTPTTTTTQLLNNGDKSSPSPKQILKKNPTSEKQRIETYSMLLQHLLRSLRAGLRAFSYAYGAKAFTAVLLASRKWNSLEYGYADCLRLLLKKDTLRFGLFTGVLVGSFRVVELLCRFIRGEHSRMNYAIAGGISGLSLLIDSPSRRSVISLYIFIRALDVTARHLNQAGYIPEVKYATEALFGICNAPIMYAFVYEPKLLPKSYYNWILRLGNVTHEGLEITIRKPLNAYYHNNPDEYVFRPCQPHYHIESCVTHNVLDFFHGISRAYPIYFPVHFLPAIIFRLKKNLKSPVWSILRVAHSALLSSMFLSSYQAIVKSSICIIRNFTQVDSSFHGWIAGIATTMSIYFEQPKRRTELMLYCSTRAMEIVWMLLDRKKVVKKIKHGEVFIFCASMIMIMCSPPQHFKNTYLQILRFMFGKSVL